ncbi:MAG: SMP-30/gluconolactonase/LRE family protein [Anaerolineaceae bacterium]|nr:SMP-30/gluconolactonase/LRE family protein [Anaerolineaceae bacterium]
MQTMQLFAEKLSAPEGPVVGPNGWILNVNSFTLKDRDWPRRAGDITATHQNRPMETHTVLNSSSPEVTGIPAALAFGPDYCLYITDEGRRSIVRVTPDGEKSDFITHYQGKQLNGPNDLCFDEEGNLFFTDPWGSSIERPIGAVYGYNWSTQELYQIHNGLAFPNGILVREGRVVAAETLTNKLWVYNITGPGRAGNIRELCRLPDLKVKLTTGPDGMAYDAEGHIYVATVGVGFVYVYDTQGILIESIPTGGVRPTNVCFGGPNHDTLFVTIDDLGTIVKIPIGIRGYRLPFCPSSYANHPWSKMLPQSPIE